MAGILGTVMSKRKTPGKAAGVFPFCHSGARVSAEPGIQQLALE
jgi:hypothetical protein